MHEAQYNAPRGACAQRYRVPCPIPGRANASRSMIVTGSRCSLMPHSAAHAALADCCLAACLLSFASRTF